MFLGKKYDFQCDGPCATIIHVDKLPDSWAYKNATIRGNNMNMIKHYCPDCQDGIQDLMQPGTKDKKGKNKNA